MRVPIHRVTGRRHGGYDAAKVRLYRAALRRREKLPPLHVARLGGVLVLMDGFHRMRGYKQEGRKTVTVQVVIDES
jgi:hypothetical protein